MMRKGFEMFRLRCGRDGYGVIRGERRARQRGGCFRVLAVVVCLLLPMIAAASPDHPPEAPDARVSRESGSPSPVHGIDLSDCVVKTARVKSGQTLSAILGRYRVPATVIYQAAAESESVFDVRRISAGRRYTVVRESSDGQRVKYFIYDQAPETFVVFDFDETVRVYPVRKSLKVRTRRVSGVIDTSMWDAFAARQMNPNLVLQLADIFASKIDFRRLQAGDRFDLAYEERFAGGKPIDSGTIQMAVLISGGHAYQAFRFKSPDGRIGYYDENGRNVQKAFLMSPLKYTRVTSGFAERRLHPIKNLYERHPAIDYAAPAGTPVMSVSDGIVSKTSYCPTGGKYITIRHSGSYTSQYLHLSAFKSDIAKNAVVTKGEVIGFVGSTGLATGPHLDFRFMKNGRYVDFASVELPSGEPVATECRQQFERKVAKYLAAPAPAAEVALVRPDPDEVRPAPLRTARN